MPSSMLAARRLLLHHFGHAEFRPAQEPVLRSVLAGRDTLAVLPTGGGKSVCFQVPALALGGLTVVVSPLIALMQDQVAAARARGIPAAALHGGVEGDARRATWAALAAGSLRLLYTSPERLVGLAPELRRRGITARLLAVDEAHCIAEWGHDFRPSYRALAAARYRLGRPPAVALTGSATPEVRRDIARALGFVPGAWDEHVSSFDRPNLWFGVVPVHTEQQRLRALLRLLAGEDRMTIVYAPTRTLTESIARALAEAGHRAEPYHAGLARDRRARTLGAFLDDRVDVIVATCAFGMGIDKPQVRLVVHWMPPATPEAYYQEAGRAGRDGELARCVLLWREGDSALHRRQLQVTFPPRELLERLWRNPAAAGVPIGVRDAAERLRRELRPERGAVDWAPVEERRRRAMARIAAVERYARNRGCRRRSLVGYFGEPLAACAGCDRCGSRPVAVPREPAVSVRLAALRRALAGCTGPWGGALLEPETLVRLARQPPRDAAALADHPGVGAEVAAGWGRRILAALGVQVDGAAAGRRGSPTPPVSVPEGRWAALLAWRERVARDLGVPPYVVLRDAPLAALAAAPPADERALARVPGLGPRALGRHGPALLALIAPAAGG